MTGDTQEVTINGAPAAVRAPLTVARLLEDLDVDPKHVAVERNRKLVPKREYASTEVCAGDEFEVVTFVGGG